MALPGTLTRFKIDETAVILIDHQVGTCSWIGSIDQPTLYKNATILAKFAAEMNMPVVLTSSLEENVQGLLLPELQSAVPKAYAARIKRAGIVNAWDDPDFAAACRATGRRNFVIAGATTDVCLVPPCISATLEGYNVQAVLDASGSPTKMADDIAIKRLQMGGVRITTTNAIVSELVANWSTKAGIAAFGLLNAQPIA